MIGFEFGIKEIVDILLVATIMYELFVLLRRSGATSLFWGVLAFIVMWFLVSYVFELELTGALFDKIINVGALAIIVIFQEEIRALFLRMGAHFSSFRLFRRGKQEKGEKLVDNLVEACLQMAATKTGALIVISQRQPLDEYIHTGEQMDSAVTPRLVENLFFKNSPLHDGAVIIQEDRIVAAACILPVSKNAELPDQYGLRHRAALGLAERTDAMAIVVSEETGHLSIARFGEIQTVTESELRRDLAALA